MIVTACWLSLILLGSRLRMSLATNSNGSLTKKQVIVTFVFRVAAVFDTASATTDCAVYVKVQARPKIFWPHSVVHTSLTWRPHNGGWCERASISCGKDCGTRSCLAPSMWTRRTKTLSLLTTVFV